jgi:hypothetical protein
VAEAADGVREVLALKTLTPVDTIYWLPGPKPDAASGVTEATALFRNTALVYRSRQVLTHTGAAGTGGA